jgi:hypothetical protein
MTEQSVLINEKQMFAEFDRKGEPEVRLLMANHRFNLEWEMAAIKWLSAKSQEAGRLRDASDAEQIEIARAASKAAERSAVAAERASAAAERQAAAAERANTRATIALAIAIISILATAFNIWVAHRDATRSGALNSTLSAQRQ